MMSGFLRWIVIVCLLELFLSTLVFVESRTVVIQKRFTQGQVCKETKNTITKVEHCPADASSLRRRKQVKQCEKVHHSSCSDEIFVYHCVRFKENLVELCAPRGLITGGCCAQFNEGVGRVIEDYNVLCSECPLNYYTNETCKYPTCVQPPSTAIKTTISHFTNGTSISKNSSNISPTNKIDCDTSHRSKRHVKCILRQDVATESSEATPFSTFSAGNEKNEVRSIRTRTSVVYISIAVSVIVCLIITSLIALFYCRNRLFKSCIASEKNTDNCKVKNEEHEKLDASYKISTVNDTAYSKNENTDSLLQTESTSNVIHWQT